MMTAYALRYALEQACRGRENHAAFVEVRAFRRHARSGVISLTWQDRFTGQSGSLGAIHAADAPELLPQVFAQLRAWRTRSESGGRLPVRVARAAGGAR